MLEIQNKIDRLIEEGEYQKAYDYIHSEICIDEKKIKDLMQESETCEYELKNILEKIIQHHKGFIYYYNLKLQQVIYYQLKESTSDFKVFINKIRELQQLLIGQPVHDDDWLFIHLPGVISKAVKSVNRNVVELYNLFEAIKELPFNKKRDKFNDMCILFINGFGQSEQKNEFIKWAEFEFINIK